MKRVVGFFCQAINVLQKLPVFTVISIFFILKNLSEIMQLYLYSAQCLAKFNFTVINVVLQY